MALATSVSTSATLADARLRMVLQPSDEQYDRLVAKGLGDLDKSGIADLPSKIAINIPPTACEWWQQLVTPLKT